MIHRLRRRHRIVILVLAVVLPLILGAALRARRVPQPMAELPPPARAGTGR